MSFTWEHALYRFYDDGGALLYVGITNSIPRRFAVHSSEKPWWPEVVDCRIAFYPDRASLARAEEDAIRYEKPRYNVRSTSIRQPQRSAPSVALKPKRLTSVSPVRRGPLAPCVPTVSSEPWMGCTCRSDAEHFGLLPA